MSEPASPIISRPYRPARCCVRCCFGRGEHAPDCAWARLYPTLAGLDNIDAILEQANLVSDPRLAAEWGRESWE